MQTFEKLYKTAKPGKAIHTSHTDRKFAGKDFEPDHCSNYNFHSFLHVAPIQTKLSVNKPRDQYEQEADRMAEEVTGMPYSVIQLKTGIDRDESIQHGNISDQFAVADSSFLNGCFTPDGESQSLSKTTRDYFEPRFGFDFSKVIIHTGNRAEEYAEAIQARAFTTGNHIAFSKGQYNSETDSGRKLLAHELSHTIQQSGASGSNNYVPVIQRQENTETKWFSFDYKLLPPELKLRLGSVMLQANTGSSELSFTRDMVKTYMGYSYGSDLYMGGSNRGFNYRLGFNPSSRQTSLGLGYNKFGFSSSVNPEQKSFGLGLSYGAPLLPMPADLSAGYNRAESGTRDILESAGNLSNPLDWYSQHKDSVKSVMDAVETTSKIAKTEPGSFGAGLQFSYNPERGILIYGRLQWIF
jgi:hypothetical protein